MRRQKWRINLASDHMVGLPRVIESRSFTTQPTMRCGISHSLCALAVVAAVVLAFALISVGI
jgi:hypothetical protein